MRLVTFTILLAALCTTSGNVQAQFYEAMSSGNFSSPSIWKDGNIPSDTIKGDLKIPAGITVNLDKNIYTKSSIRLDGTPTGDSSIYIHDAFFTMGPASALTVDSVYINSPLQTYVLNSNFAPKKLAISYGGLQPYGVNIEVTNLYIEPGQAIIYTGITIKQNGHIFVRSQGGIPLYPGSPTYPPAPINLNNTYDVTYQVQAKNTGIELLGSGLRNVTIDLYAFAFSEIYATGGVNIKNGTLKIIDGNFNIAGGELKISDDGQIDFAGQGKLKSFSDSRVIIDKPGKTLNTPLQFEASGNTIKTLYVNTAGDVSLADDLRVTDTVQFAAGRLNLQGQKLSLVAGGKVYNASATSYIVADGGGALVADIAPNTSVNFPIGTSAHYTPCTVTSKNNIPYNSFSASVVADVKNRGTMGSSISGTQPLVNATWLFDHNPPNNIALDVELMWSADMEVNNFDRGNCYMSHLVGATWDKQSTSAATETNGMYSIRREGMTHLSALAVFDGNTVDVPTISKEPTIKIYPNPATDVLYVDATEAMQACIYNTMGQMLINTTISPDNDRIDVAELPSGLYLIQLTGSADNSYSSRFYK